MGATSGTLNYNSVNVRSSQVDFDNSVRRTMKGTVGRPPMHIAPAIPALTKQQAVKARRRLLSLFSDNMNPDSFSVVWTSGGHTYDLNYGVWSLVKWSSDKGDWIPDDGRETTARLTSPKTQ